MQSTVQLDIDTEAGEDIHHSIGVPVEGETDEHDSSLAKEDIPEVVGLKEGMSDTVDDKMWFIRPKSENLDSFLLFHPCQPVVLSFNSTKLYQRRDGKKRHWLTYSHGHGAFFCMVCLAFSKKTDDSAFIDGCFDEKHMYQRIEEHERSNLHNNSSESLLMRSKNMDISSHFFEKQTTARKEEVKRKRAILERIIETIKLIGKRGLSYRATAEAAYTLDNEKVDHGNFLDILLLLSKFDPLLKNHFDTVIKKSKKQHQSAASSKGRGGFVTLITKTTVNNIICVISALLKKGIAQEIRDAGMFSIQLDTTQDTNVSDQCSIIIRYVTDVVHERLVAVVNCTSTPGNALCELVCNVLESMEIEVTNCVGNSTDGASNMQGQYNGFSTWLSNKAPGLIHVWCYAHVLNLVMMDVIKISVQAILLFGLLNSCAVFIRESYLRMNVWREKSQEESFRSLSVIGETRWWSRDAALTKVFGSFNDPSQALYVDFIQTMAEISRSDHFNADIRYKAGTYLESLQKFHTLIMAQLYLFVFKNSTPLSFYPQTQGMDVLQAYQMVTETVNNLQAHDRDSQMIIDAAKKFAVWANRKLDTTSCKVLIEEDFPSPRRIQREKRMAGELAVDEPILLASDQFRVEVYNVTLDKIINSLHSQFTTHGQLFADLDILLDLPSSALERLSSLVTKFDSNATKEKLRSELLDFASKWQRLKMSLDEEYTDANNEGQDEDTIHSHFISETEEQPYSNVGDKSGKCKTCKSCIACCYNVLLHYNLYSLTYSSLFNAYKLTLTLSSSQVACERSFSKLKYILNRLRNSLSQTHLEAFMLMSVEKEALIGLSNEAIIDVLASKKAAGYKRCCLHNLQACQ
ncbi:zinc finger MYM-type 1-like [Pelobates cultripes]|uniref:Zinc finger MYM-type 1-like n=1 Tax=Pelobates cultripes TaxID=61616 RepID=A0AAD1TKW3_PELCU|nr:zinc finger MYM-type 1-like [Pelobates cultripes]